MKLTDVVGDYDREFDMSALDTDSPWLPTPPVVDAESSETRGVVEDTLIERERTYGDFADNSQTAQNIKIAMRVSPAWYKDRLTDYQKEALELIASKIGRLLSGDPNYLDNWHDIAGYATLVEQRINKRSTR